MSTFLIEGALFFNIYRSFWDMLINFNEINFMKLISQKIFTSRF